MLRGMRRAIALSLLLASCGEPAEPVDSGVPVADASPDAGSMVGDCPSGDGAFAVTEVRGSIEDGAEIVVCGDLFGALGPEILLFDDMEGRLAGGEVGATDPVIGAWTDPGGL